MSVDHVITKRAASGILTIAELREFLAEFDRATATSGPPSYTGSFKPKAPGLVRRGHQEHYGYDPRRERAAVTDVQQHIRRTRMSRVVIVLAAVLSALILAANVAWGFLLTTPFSAAGIIACVVVIVMHTRRIGILRARERELNRPRMTPEDYRQLREMEIELGWEPSEVPASVAELAPGFTLPPALTLPVTDTTTMADFELGVARLYATLGTLYGTLGMPPAPEAEQAEPPSSAPMTGPGGRWHPVSELPEVKAAIAAAHFAELANVGRESCIGFCPICGEREGIS
jgi:hypothetical protein